MITMRKTAVILLLSVLMLPSISQAETLSFEINANSDDIEGKVEAQFYIYETPLHAGFGIIYSDKDYILSNLNFALKSEIFISALTLGLGFKGVFGEADIALKEFDVGVLSFLIQGEYDFRKDISNLPISICLSFSVAPDPLSFSDTERYYEFVSTLNGYIVENAAVVIGYRNINLRLDDSPNIAKKSEDAVFFGLKLIF